MCLWTLGKILNDFVEGRNTAWCLWQNERVFLCCAFPDITGSEAEQCEIFIVFMGAIYVACIETVSNERNVLFAKWTEQEIFLLLSQLQCTPAIDCLIFHTIPPLSCDPSSEQNAPHVDVLLMPNPGTHPKMRWDQHLLCYCTDTLVFMDSCIPTGTLWRFSHPCTWFLSKNCCRVDRTGPSSCGTTWLLLDDDVDDGVYEAHSEKMHEKRLRCLEEILHPTLLNFNNCKLFPSVCSASTCIDIDVLNTKTVAFLALLE